MVDLGVKLEIERLQNLATNFGWRLVEQRDIKGEVTLTFTKSFKDLDLQDNAGE